MSQLFRRKSIDALLKESEEPSKRLSKTLGPWSLIALGVGAVIGSGIFTLTGTAAAGTVLEFPSIWHAPVLDIVMSGFQHIQAAGRPGAGPAISVSFILVAFACAFAALCYAELSSMIPIAGSAYTYAYATLGEIFAWIIGWDLILEYAVSNMAVAVGFSAYFNDMLDGLFGVHLPRSLSEPMVMNGHMTGSYFNLPAFLILMVLSWILVLGVKEGAVSNNIMVLIKIVAIGIFVFGASRAIKPGLWHPFAPNGFSGIISGAAIVFFTYIGFDSVSTAAEECKNPARDMPIGIVGTLIICTVLYVSVCVVLTGIVDYRTLANDAPVANALKAIGYDNLRRWVTVGALFGMLSSLLVFQYGQARIWFAMSRDKLLPGLFSRVHKKHRTPHVSTWIAGLVVGIPAGIWDIGTFAELSNIGTLFAFALVSAGVIVLRRTDPGRKRGFRVPWSPFLPCVAIFLCLILMLGLPLATWMRFFVWLVLGLAVYFFSGKQRAAAQSEG
ncbi:MAG: amino acid permease [Bryobacteraceae bacterium]